MDIMRQQDDNDMRTVSLSSVLDEISCGVVAEIRRDGLTIRMRTLSGIRVTYVFPAALEYLMGWLTIPTDQLQWLADFAGITGITNQYVDRMGWQRVRVALLSDIDRRLGGKNTPTYHSRMLATSTS